LHKLSENAAHPLLRYPKMESNDCTNIAAIMGSERRSTALLGSPRRVWTPEVRLSIYSTVARRKLCPATIIITKAKPPITTRETQIELQFHPNRRTARIGVTACVTGLI